MIMRLLVFTLHYFDLFSIRIQVDKTKEMISSAAFKLIFVWPFLPQSTVVQFDFTNLTDFIPSSWTFAHQLFWPIYGSYQKGHCGHLCYFD